MGMRHVILVPMCLLAACASTRATQRGTDSAPPDAGVAQEDEATRKARLTALFERESQPSPDVTFTVLGKAVTVESSQPVTVTREEASASSTVSIGLGASTPMTCSLFDAPVQVGLLVTRTLAAVKAKVEVVQVRPGGIEVIEKSPAVFLDVAYAVTSNGARSVGQLQLMAFASDDAPLFCSFDEPGYVKSFHRVAGGLATSLARALAKPGDVPTFRTVDITRIQGMPVGFGKTVWRKGKDGTGTFSTVGAMLVPRSPVDWLTTDQSTVATVAKDGTLKEKRFVVVSNGEPDRELVLSRVKVGQYTYGGTVQGKALKGVLKTHDKKDLPSDVLSARRIKRELLTGKAKELKIEDYVPDANPAGLTVVTVRKEAGPNEVTMELGPMKLEATVDATGVTERAALHAGPVTIVEERAYNEGAVE